MNVAAPVRRGTWHILAYNIDGNCLKGITEKRKTAEFRKRISAKTAVFSVFKSVKRVDKKRRHQNLSAVGARSYSHIVKVSFYPLFIFLMKKPLTNEKKLRIITMLNSMSSNGNHNSIL